MKQVFLASRLLPVFNMRKTVFRQFISLCLLAMIPPASADIGQFAQEREVYQQAIKAIQEKNIGIYKQSRRLLKDYPLMPYLDYAYILTTFIELPVQRVESFLKKHGHTYIGRKLNYAWLAYLGNHGHWSVFRQFYTDDYASDTNICYKIQGDIALAQSDAEKHAAYLLAGEQWTKPYSLPKSCDTLFANWENAGYMTEELAWKRFQLAFGNNNVSLARYLTRFLNEQHTALAKKMRYATSNTDFWTKTLENPAIEITLESVALKRIIRNITNQNNTLGALLLDIPHLALDDEDRAELEKLNAWYLAKSSGTKALEWISSKSRANHQYAEEQLHYAMLDKNWPQYQDIFINLPANIQQDEEWLYWYAVSQEDTGIQSPIENLRPDAIYNQLAEKQSFYGYLAAEQLDKNLLENSFEQISNVQIEQRVYDLLAPAFEFYYLDQYLDANRVWYHTTKHFTVDEWQQAAMLAHDAKWYNRTIQAFAKANMWHAIEERFPLAYLEHFEKNAEKQSVDQSWLLAMARQESGFSPTARSPVGATGILQLMPRTARRVASSLNLRYSKNKLTDPDFNITLGSRYLKDMLERFDNNYILATAAYNAGPHRVKEWLELRPMTEDWAHWVASIPYRETREYVKNILTYSKIYHTKLNKKTPPLISQLVNDSPSQGTTIQ